MSEYIKSIMRRIRIHSIRIISHQKNIDFNSRNLIIAPHPDDETLGCAGLIQQLLATGKKVDIIYMTGGGKSHSGCCDIDETTLMENRRNLAKTSAAILGLPQENLHFLDYTDGGIAYECEETGKLRNLLKEMNPEAIFIPHKGEGWSDHIKTGEIVKSLLQDNNKTAIYEYCVWFWYYNIWNINWKNARTVTMTKKQQKKKLQAMDGYTKPLAPCGRPWSGVLPEVFLWANKWNKELYFKIK